MFERILVPVDGSPTSDHALAQAISMAQYSGGSLRLIHVIDDLSFSIGMAAYAGYSGDSLSLLRADGEAILKQARAIASAGDVDVETMMDDTRSGLVHVQVMAQARRWPADVIVLGTHGRRGVGGMLLGSGAENILRYATVPVLLVRAPDDAPEARKSEAPSRSKVAAGKLAVH